MLTEKLTLIRFTVVYYLQGFTQRAANCSILSRTRFTEYPEHWICTTINNNTNSKLEKIGMVLQFLQVKTVNGHIFSTGKC